MHRQGEYNYLLPPCQRGRPQFYPGGRICSAHAALAAEIVVSPKASSAAPHYDAIRETEAHCTLEHSLFVVLCLRKRMALCKDFFCAETHEDPPSHLSPPTLFCNVFLYLGAFAFFSKRRSFFSRFSSNIVSSKKQTCSYRNIFWSHSMCSGHVSCTHYSFLPNCKIFWTSQICYALRVARLQTIFRTFGQSHLRRFRRSAVGEHWTSIFPK